MLEFSKDPCYDKLETSKCEAKKANGKCDDIRWTGSGNRVNRYVRRHCKSTCDICGKSVIGF